MRARGYQCTGVPNWQADGRPIGTRPSGEFSKTLTQGVGPQAAVRCGRQRSGQSENGHLGDGRNFASAGPGPSESGLSKSVVKATVEGQTANPCSFGESGKVMFPSIISAVCNSPYCEVVKCVKESAGAEEHRSKGDKQSNSTQVNVTISS
jgi:hypothetical protein